MKTLEASEALILTPEHVPIRLVPAGLGARFMALVIDLLITWALVLAASMLNRLLFGARGIGFQLTVSFLIQWGYHVWFEVRHQGRSPGKRICGLRVVDARGLPVTFQQSFIRNIVRVLDAAPVFYGLGALACSFDPLHRRLGDRAADTLVIQEHPPLDPTRALSGERRFNSLQTRGVLRRVRRLVGVEQREFLLGLCLRADQLDPVARFDLMEEVGAHYRRLLDVDDPHLSGENLVRGLLSILYTTRQADR